MLKGKDLLLVLSSALFLLARCNGCLKQLDCLNLTIVGTIVDPILCTMLSKDIAFAVRVFAVKLFLGDSDLSDKVGGDDLLKNSLGGGLVAGEGVTLGTMDQMEVTGVLPVDELFFTHCCCAVFVCTCSCELMGKEISCVALFCLLVALREVGGMKGKEE